MREASYHLTLLAQNRTGFQNLMKLASAAYLEGFYFKPRIDKELLEQHNEGLICLSGCVSSEFNRALLRGHGGEEELKEAMEVAQWFHRVFGDRYFIEIMNNGVEIQRLAMEGAVDVANRLGLPLVATSDAHYVDRDDAEAQDVMLCINTGKFRTDTSRLRMDGNEYYLAQPAGDVRLLSRPWTTPWRAARRLPTRSTWSWNWASGTFPTFTLPEDKTAEQLLRELCEQGCGSATRATRRCARAGS